MSRAPYVSICACLIVIVAQWPSICLAVEEQTPFSSESVAVEVAGRPLSPPMIEQNADSVSDAVGEPHGPDLSHAIFLNEVGGLFATPELKSMTALMQVETPPLNIDLGTSQGVDASSFAQSFASQSDRFGVGVDLYSAPDFEGGLIVLGRNVAMKIGGYVKADFIYDFDPIDNTDAFDTTTIDVDAPDRTNFRAHARQTRLSFDTRWKTNSQIVRILVEADFFSDRDRFRLRRAFGEVGRLLVGQTWTTFADISASPATLDFEGSVSNVNRRQAQARWTQDIIDDFLSLALSVEDARFIIIPPPGVTGDSRSPSPDFVAQGRIERDWGQFEVAYLYRVSGFQPTGGKVFTGSAGGFNISGTVVLVESTKAYYQILFGDGIGSYRGLPDAAPISATEGELLPLFAWMVGVTHDWNDRLSSNFTYAENSLDPTPLQDIDDVRGTTYLAANLIWNPMERVKVGIEYLYGTRENVDRRKRPAHRIQTAFIFDLP